VGCRVSGVGVVGYINRRNVIFFVLTIVGAGMVYGPLRDLLGSGARSEYYSHITLIPLVSICLIYWERKNLFREAAYSYRMGIILLLFGVLLYLIGTGQKQALSQNDYSGIITLAGVVFWIGAFTLSYGYRAFRLAIFPLLFLAFMIPIPTVLMDEVIYLLQVGSTEVTYVLFQIIGVPVSRDGFTFHLPNISIEVAKECSGIRSSLALFITSFLSAHFFLKTGWRKAVLIPAIIPITIFKNGIRIVTLSLLAVYVDERFITGGFLHKSGGFVFYIPALGLLGIILLFLRKSEKRTERRRMVS